MKFLLFVACALIIADSGIAKKLEIEILYESLCPDSMRFINNQLAPVYQEIAQHVNLTFVPFGKAYSDKNQEFECQHGPTECRGNLIQSCVLNVLPSQLKQVQFVDCFMKTFISNPVEEGQKCATQVGVQWEIVKQCVNSKSGTMLQLHAERMTNVYSPSFIPTIVYDKTFDQEAQDDSIVAFRNYVCERLQRTHPKACPVMKLRPV